MPRSNADEGPSRALVEYALTHAGRWVRSSGIPEADREDVTQEVLIKVIRHAHAYDTARPMGPWLGAIAFRTAHDFRRRAGHRHEVLMEIDDEPGEGPSFDPAARLSNERVAEVLEAIPPARRDVLVRAARDGAPMAEIAAEMGISIDAGYLRLSRARAQFKILWERLAGEAMPSKVRGVSSKSHGDSPRSRPSAPAPPAGGGCKGRPVASPANMRRTRHG